ncbi:MAG: TetR/AcrR family transcriptional regulator [Acidimicrobiales bacterium]|jgi:AcrR family transcriptional regulator|nr:TetR/AcrR family transcriptional regulator [Acidimicrobiales bacterium]
MGATSDTRRRVLDAALSSFGTRGYDATSLDQLAVELGIRKQTILYYFPSKAELLDAVIDHSSGQLASVLVEAASVGEGFERVERIVRSVFRLALRRPELLGLLREVSRLGPPAATRLSGDLEPLVDSARVFLEAEMTAGRFRRCDARLLLLSTYSTVLGVATEVEVLRAVGVEPTLRSAVLRRRELLRFLRSALVSDAVSVGDGQPGGAGGPSTTETSAGRGRAPSRH